MQPEAETK
jgi:transposase-like protein